MNTDDQNQQPSKIDNQLENHTQQTEQAPPQSKGSILKGLGIFGLVLLVSFALIQFVSTFLYQMIDWSFNPLIDVIMMFIVILIPIAVMIFFNIRYKKETKTIQGLWIGFGITVLLVSACFGIIITNL